MQVSAVDVNSNIPISGLLSYKAVTGVSSVIAREKSYPHFLNVQPSFTGEAGSVIKQSSSTLSVVVFSPLAWSTVTV